MNDLKLENGGWRLYDFNTDSFWHISRRDSSGQHKGDYHGNFVPQIPSEFIQRFTKQSDWILDVFAGSGTSLLCAKELGRNAVGFDISQTARDLTNNRLRLTRQHDALRLQTCYVHDLDCLDPQSYATFADEQFQLVFVHPPYLDIIKFSDDARCLGARTAAGLMQDRLVEFTAYMQRLGENFSRCLAPGGHVVYVIGDVYRAKEWHLLGFESWKGLKLGAGLTLKATVVKNVAGNERTRGKFKNLWRYRHLRNGTFDFKHEYIFVGKKEK